MRANQVRLRTLAFVQRLAAGPKGETVTEIVKKAHVSGAISPAIGPNRKLIGLGDPLIEGTGTKWRIFDKEFARILAEKDWESAADVVESCYKEYNDFLKSKGANKPGRVKQALLGFVRESKVQVLRPEDPVEVGGKTVESGFIDEAVIPSNRPAPVENGSYHTLTPKGVKDRRFYIPNNRLVTFTVYNFPEDLHNLASKAARDHNATLSEVIADAMEYYFRR